MTDSTADIAPPWLPPGLRLRVDLGELGDRSVAVASTQRDLEQDFGCHIAVYRLDATGQAHGLCSMYRAAQLSSDQQSRLGAAESRFPDVAFVAYAKPLVYQRCVDFGEFRVPRIGLGTMRLIGPGAWGPPLDAEHSSKVLQAAVRHGIRLLDTADAYGPSHCETLIAETLHPYPHDLVLCTKGGIDRRGPDQWIPNGTPAHLRKACEASLRRLRIDSIPLYLLHTVDPDVPIEDSVGEMQRLQASGKIQNIGICNVSIEQIERAASVAPIACVQNLYNHTDRTHQDVVTYCEERRIPFVAWGPLNGGRLASRNPAVERSDGGGATEALRWILLQSPMTTAIPGAATVDELLDDIAALC